MYLGVSLRTRSSPCCVDLGGLRTAGASMPGSGRVLVVIILGAPIHAGIHFNKRSQYPLSISIFLLKTLRKMPICPSAAW